MQFGFVTVVSKYLNLGTFLKDFLAVECSRDCSPKSDHFKQIYHSAARKKR
jgi:hypothetical protein